jgi:hypothetical protein
MSNDVTVDILLALKSRLEGADQTLGFLGKLTGGLTAGVIAYKAFALAASSTQLAQEIKTLAERSNMASDAFQVLSIKAKEANVTQEDISRTAVVLRKNLEDAAKDGASPLAQHLRTLHLTAVGLQAIAPERQFEIIGKRIAEATDKEAAFNAGMELLGSKNAPKLLKFLEELGVEGFDKFADSAKALIISKEDLETLDKAANAWERIGLAMKVAGAQTTVSVVNNLQSAFGMDKNGAIIQQQQLVWDAEQKIADKRKNGVKKGDYGIPYWEQFLKGAREEFAKLVLKDGDQANIQQAIFWLKKYGDEFVDLQKKLEASVASRSAKAAEVQKAMADAEMFPGLRGYSADRSAPNNHFDKLSAKISNRDRELDLRISEKMTTSVRAQRQEQEKFAESIRSSVDPTLQYRREIELVKQAETDGLISKDEMSKRIAQLNLQMQTAGGLLQGMDDRLSAIRRQVELLDANRFLTDEQKRAERIRLLKLENAAIDEQITKLKEIVGLSGPEGDRHRREIRGLEDKKTGNAAAIERDSPLGLGGELHVAGINQVNALGTTAQIAARGVGDVWRQTFDSIQGGVVGLLNRTQTFGDFLRNIGISFGNSMINAFAKMLVEYAQKKAAMFLVDQLFAAKSLALSLASSAKSLVAWIPSAIAASISSYGVAAAIGLAAVVAVLASRGFKEGDYTGDGDPNAPAGIVHRREFVFDAESTSRLGVPYLRSLRSGHQSPAMSGAGAVAGPAGGGKQERLIMVVPNMSSARALSRDPEFDNVIVDAMRRNRGAAAES